MSPLHNRISRKELQKQLMEEDFRRITISFYRYIRIEDPEQLRDDLYKQWTEWDAFGRIYLAQEGFNAQMSLPDHHYEAFKESFDKDPIFENTPIKEALEDDGKSFYKLDIKVKPKLVNDGLLDDAFDSTNVGRHLSADEFNEALQDENSVAVDMRNFYEYEVGHFKGALQPDSMTFREGLEKLPELLDGREENKVLLYCTGGIRCEKASAFLKSRGFRDVNQLHGGIIDYTRQVKSEGLENRFLGKNFVFDQRLGERVSGDVIAHCHQCGAPADTHTNCANDICHLLFIQCENCANEFDGCCTTECRDVLHLPEKERLQLRKTMRRPPGYRRGKRVIRF